MLTDRRRTESEALFYKTTETDLIDCLLCPSACRLKSGQIGLCGTRKNDKGIMRLLNYGHVSAIHIDPMEKKPLYHFLPGQMVLSLGNNGCNLRCSFCQNWQISQMTVATTVLTPLDILNRALLENLPAVAFTYAEPMVWYEFVMDTAKILHHAGIKVVLVSNGQINTEPLQALLPWIDAMNIDIKSMDPDFYRRLCKGTLKPVLDSCRLAVEHCHLEITNLIIPGENDSDDNFRELALFMSNNLGINTPLHFSRYHPAYHLTTEPTPEETLLKAADIASEFLNFVYLGNLPSQSSIPTQCPQCQHVLINRTAFHAQTTHLDSDGDCLSCGYQTGIVMS